MRVTRRTLCFVAGLVWLMVGLGLSLAGLWFVFGRSDAGVLAIVASLGIGGLLGWFKGAFVLSRTARRNRVRIQALPDPRIWQVFTGRFVLLILGMMALGRGLRFLAAQGWLGGFAGVGGIYFGVGLALVAASRRYFQRDPDPMPTRLEQEPEARSSRRGTLLVNLGSPAAPTTTAVRAFLRQFLGDPRVVEVNRVLWAFVLHCIILPFRSAKSAALYRTIWTPEGSPLLVHSRSLRDRLAERLGAGSPVALGMRYGEPSMQSALDELREQGCDEVTVVPLFPQFSNTTTGSVLAEVLRVASLRRDPPALTFVPPFFDHPQYIEALAVQAERHDRGDFTVFSFHGIPESYVRRGDPYLDHCGRTAWALARRLGLQRHEWEMVFQSRFGDEPWLQPYLDEFVPALAPDRPRVRVIAPSFAADCLETLEEIGVRLNEDFLAAGGQELIVVPCLNDDPVFVNALAAMLGQEARVLTGSSGWTTARTDQAIEVDT